MYFQIFLVSVIIIICIIANKFSDKIGMPSLLLFLLLGMLFGSDGIFKINFNDYKITEHICTVALIFIMFYGGFSTNWNVARKVALEAFLLSTIGVVITSILTSLFAYYVLKFDILGSFLIGAVVSSTDAASVFSILKSKKLNLKNGLASILELESGSNDPTAYMLTIIVLSLMSKTINAATIWYMLFSQIIFGLAIGIAVGLLAVYVLKRFATELESIFVLAIALLSFGLSSLLDGNGYLSAYIAGIILGNSKIKNKVTLVHFFDGITGLMQVMVFFLLGLLSFPSEIPNIALPSILIVLFLTFVARPVAVFSILTPFKRSFKEQALISIAGIRGVASIVFAIMAITNNDYTKNDIFHIVFFLALLSVSLQGTLLPILSKWLNLVDKNSDVLKTFTDYVDEDYSLIEIYVSNIHNWVNKKIKNIVFPFDSIVVMIVRGDKSIMPKGDTIIKRGDRVILNCKKYKEIENIDLSEIFIDKKHEWVNSYIRDIDTRDKGLIIMLKRNEKNIIPNGDTIIRDGDVLILSHSINKND